MSDRKSCTKCGVEKELTEFYSRLIPTKTRGDVLRHSSEGKVCNIKRARERTLANPEKAREASRKTEQRPERRQKQLEKAKDPAMKAKNQEWRKNNGDKLRGYVHKRRALKAELINDLTEAEWDRCIEYFGHACAYCGKSEEENRISSGLGGALEREPVTPMSKGGGYTVTNIVPACRACNGSKHNADFSEWYPQQQFYSEERYDKIIAYFSDALVAKYSQQDSDRDERFFLLPKKG